MQHDPFTFLARWLSLFSEGKRNFQSIPPVKKLNSKTSQSRLHKRHHHLSPGLCTDLFTDKAA